MAVTSVLVLVLCLCLHGQAQILPKLTTTSTWASVAHNQQLFYAPMQYITTSTIVYHTLETDIPECTSTVAARKCAQRYECTGYHLQINPPACTLYYSDYNGAAPYIKDTQTYYRKCTSQCVAVANFSFEPIDSTLLTYTIHVSIEHGLILSATVDGHDTTTINAKSATLPCDSPPSTVSIATTPHNGIPLLSPPMAHTSYAKPESAKKFYQQQGFIMLMVFSGLMVVGAIWAGIQYQKEKVH